VPKVFLENEGIRFAADSLLEGDGFEPSVPVKKNPPVETII
jgi:hypothetical protein